MRIEHFADVFCSRKRSGCAADPGKDGKRWSQPLSALLGAFKAQMELGIGAIGGKDSMSGTFENIDVPPTLVSFAVTTSKTDRIVSPEFKKAGNKVIFLPCPYDENNSVIRLVISWGSTEEDVQAFLKAI